MRRLLVHFHSRKSLILTFPAEKRGRSHAPALLFLMGMLHNCMATFREFLLEVKTPPHIPGEYFKNAMKEAEEMERQLRVLPRLSANLEKVAREVSGRNYLSDIFNYLPSDLRRSLDPKKSNYTDNPYSVRIKEFLDAARHDNFNITRSYAKRMTLYGSEFKEKLSRFYKEYADQKHELDRLGDEIDASIDEPGFAQYKEMFLTYKQKLEVLFRYIRWAKNFETKAEAFYHGFNSREQEVYKGNPLRPPEKEVEVLYHATIAATEIEKQGFRADTEKALGGETEGAISFTADLAIAREIARAFRETIAIAKGQVSMDQLLKQAKSMGISEEQLKTPLFDYKVYKEKQGLGLSSFRNNEAHYVWQVYRYMLSHMPGRYDPLFFGVNIERFENLDPRNVGVIAARVNMSQIKKYLRSMEEYRVPINAILSIKRIN